MAFSKTYDGDEPVRINKWLGQTGVCSRREADALIADGLVSIDGEVVTDAGRKIEPGQTLTLSDRAETALAEARAPRVLAQPVGHAHVHAPPHQ
jgi:23S rRNA pseudouridine2604 synthase